MLNLARTTENSPLKKVEIASGYIDNKNPVTKSRLWQEIHIKHLASKLPHCDTFFLTV